MSASVAELLDADAEGYVAAVDAAAEALREPERTPSAALLAALKTEQASFFEYTLTLARTHAAYFRDFALAERASRCSPRRPAGRSRRPKRSSAKDSRPFEATSGLLRGDLGPASTLALFVIPLTAAPCAPARILAPFGHSGRA